MKIGKLIFSIPPIYKTPIQNIIMSVGLNIIKIELNNYELANNIINEAIKMILIKKKFVLAYNRYVVYHRKGH